MEWAWKRESSLRDSLDLFWDLAHLFVLLAYWGGHGSFSGRHFISLSINNQPHSPTLAKNVVLVGLKSESRESGLRTVFFAHITLGGYLLEEYGDSKYDRYGASLWVIQQNLKGVSQRGSGLFGLAIYTPLYSFCTYIIFLCFVYFWDRGRQSMRRGGAERGRHRIWSRLQALSCQHRAQCGAWTHKPWNHDLSWSWTLNQLSHQAHSTTILL